MIHVKYYQPHFDIFAAMKALVQKQLHKYPEFEDFEIQDHKGEKVDLMASALNHRDLWISKGKYPGLQFPTILGSDGSGIYKGIDVVINPSVEWGTVEHFQGASFRVLGMPDHGTFAEKIIINDSNICNKPDHLDYFEAAALPLAGLTAYRAFMLKCLPKRGEKVLINGIGGGVATMAFLFALANENEVFVTSSSNAKIELAKKMGAVEGVNYLEEQWTKRLKEICGGVDVIIDSAAGKSFGGLLSICNPGARIAIYGGTKGDITALNPQILFWKQISIFGSTMGSNKDFEDMLDYVSLHDITPIIHKVIPMSQADEAFNIMNNGKQFGKIVLDNKA